MISFYPSFLSKKATAYIGQIIPFFLIAFGLLLSSFSANAQSGSVFRDYNANGTKDTNEPLVSGVLVKAYNTGGSLCASTTSAGTTAPNYTLPTTCSGQVRVEFEIPATNTNPGGAVAGLEYTTYGGSNYGSSVQFVAAGATNINFGVYYPADYTGTNPILGTPCYVNGSRTSNVAEPAVVLFNDNDRGQGVPHPIVATIGEVGSVWGETYNPSNKKLYVSAFIKRHSDISPNGLGAIYEIDVTTPTTAGAGTPTLWLDINAATFVNQSNVAVNLGFPADPGAASRGLGAKTLPNRDNWGFANMGRQGIGDIELSADGLRMYVMDLTNRQVLCIDYTTKKLIWKLAVSTPTCLGGSADIRPWALKERKGILYVGAICSGETNQNSAQLHYYVMKCNSLTAATSMSLAADLGSATNKQNGNFWNPWFAATAPAWIQALPNNGYWVAGQPIISDIEFDKNENMIVGFMDRSGHQTGYKNYLPNVSNTNLVNGIGVGDITRAVNNGTTYTVETAPWSFFNLTAAIPSPPDDQFVGGMVITNSNDNYVVANMIDPFGYDSNGVVWDKSSDGQQQGGTNATGRLEIVPQVSDVSMFGKGSGLGDLSVFPPLPPIEIGNRVWNDTDKDGIQDANENGIQNVTIELYADFNNDGVPDGAALATTQTSATGTWYFNNSNVTDGDPVTAGNQTGLAPNKNYLIRVGSADWTSGAGAGDLLGLKLTTKDATSTGLVDVADNDAALANNIPTIAYKTGDYGQNNHTLDMGFNCTPAILTATATPATCTGGTANSDAKIQFTSSSADKYKITQGATSTATYATATAITANAGSLTAIANPASATQYTIRVFNGGDACYKDTTITLNTVVCTLPNMPLPPATNCCTTPIMSGNGNFETSNTNIFNNNVGGYPASFLQSNGQYPPNVGVVGNTAVPTTWGIHPANNGLDNTELRGIYYVNAPNNKFIWIRGTGICLSNLQSYKDLKPCTKYKVCVQVAGWSPTQLNSTSYPPDGTLTGSVDVVINGVNTESTFTVDAPAKIEDITWKTISIEFTTPSTLGSHFEVALSASGFDGGNDGLIYDNFQLCDLGSVAPIVSVSPKTKTICQGGIVGAYTATTTPNTGIQYKWYGPLADSTSTLGIAISGATNASFTPSGANLPTADGIKKYYAVIAKNSPDACSDTAFVAITVSPKPTATAGSNSPLCEGSKLDLTSSGGTTYAWAGPNSFSSTQQNPSITGASTAASGIYTVTVSNASSCTATATTAVIINGLPSLTATPSACVQATNNYSLSGNLTFANPPTTGTLTVSVGAITQVFNAPFSSPQAYTLSGLTSDGASHTVTATFSASPACSGTVNYTAPASCLCPTGNCGTVTVIKN